MTIAAVELLVLVFRDPFDRSCIPHEVAIDSNATKPALIDVDS